MEWSGRKRRGVHAAFWSVVVGCLLSASAVASGASLRDVEEFLGLWQGVDSLDGSPVRLSLSDIDGDGVLAHTLQEDFFTACFNLGSAYSRGRGVITGTATVAKRGVLDATTELICISDANVPHSLGATTVQYTLRPRTVRSREQVLVLPPFGSLPGMVLHRVAP